MGQVEQHHTNGCRCVLDVANGQKAVKSYFLRSPRYLVLSSYPSSRLADRYDRRRPTRDLERCTGGLFKRRTFTFGFGTGNEATDVRLKPDFDTVLAWRKKGNGESDWHEIDLNDVKSIESKGVFLRWRFHFLSLFPLPFLFVDNQQHVQAHAISATYELYVAKVHDHH